MLVKFFYLMDAVQHVIIISTILPVIEEEIHHMMKVVYL